MGRNNKKTEIDFSQCRFIKEEMWYFTYKDFYKSRKVIKKMFDNLDKDGKLFYMWYVYANINMNLKCKHAIWDYLNDYDPLGERLGKLTRSCK